MRKKSIRLDMTGGRRLSTGNCSRNLNLTIRTSDICTNKNIECLFVKRENQTRIEVQKNIIELKKYTLQ